MSNAFGRTGKASRCDFKVIESRFDLGKRLEVEVDAVLLTCHVSASM